VVFGNRKQHFTWYTVKSVLAVTCKQKYNIQLFIQNGTEKITHINSIVWPNLNVKNYNVSVTSIWDTTEANYSLDIYSNSATTESKILVFDSLVESIQINLAW